MIATEAPTARRRAWVFDVDGCLIDSMSGDSLRPLVPDLLDALTGAGVEIVLWSAGGQEYARRRAEQFGFDHLLTATYGKVERDESGAWSVAEVLAGHDPELFVDDLPHELPASVDVIGVRPYLAENRHDKALAGLLERATVA